MNSYTASVVGCGTRGKLSLVAYDVKPQALEEIRTLYPGIEVYSSHEQMFRACPADVVSVSTFLPRTCRSRVPRSHSRSAESWWRSRSAILPTRDERL